MLEAKAKSGAMAVNPAVSTMAGNLVMAAGGQRVVNKDHPLAGDYGTRASSHMVSRVGRDPASQTMFGMVPGAIPVNAAIGQNPQIYMNEPLPNVPGLTTVKGVSTGIVSGEAARWHAMMATLGMQSKAEIETLKKTIAATGTVSKEFMMQFDDILPVVSISINDHDHEFFSSFHGYGHYDDSLSFFHDYGCHAHDRDHDFRHLFYLSSSETTKQKTLQCPLLILFIKVLPYQ